MVRVVIEGSIEEKVSFFPDYNLPSAEKLHCHLNLGQMKNSLYTAHGDWPGSGAE